jgi:hypothetical protein
VRITIGIGKKGNLETIKILNKTSNFLTKQLWKKVIINMSLHALKVGYTHVIASR